MAWDPDETVCYCFHVPYRKVEKFCRIKRPKVPSQISECLSAGTGCGWCIPLLKKIHAQQCGKPEVVTSQAENTAGPNSASIENAARPSSASIEDPAAYAEARRRYLQEKKPPEQ